MLSVIIPTTNAERLLVPTLAALVPGATEGLISEVLVADAGSTDETAAIADVAGCNILVAAGPLAQRLKKAATAARAPWLLFVPPGTVLDIPWTGEVRRFIEQPASRRRAAAFRRGAAPQPGLRGALALLAAPFRTRPRPEQGLLIAKSLYEAIGGHSGAAVDPQTELFRRIGRRRLVAFSTRAFAAEILD